MSDDGTLQQRAAQIELALINIQTILVCMAALMAACATYALAYVESNAGEAQSLPFWGGFAAFIIVGLALRPRKPRSSARKIGATAESRNPSV